MGMKLAISGKGGVGKTTIAALLARAAAARGYRVLAVDADPDANLAATLGFPEEGITPLAELRELIAERAGSEGLIKLNPKVDDIPERYSLYGDGIRLMVLGAVRRGGGGCACPENSFLRALLRHLLLERDELVIVDMEAGLEPLGRGTVEAVDALLVVVDPDRRSLQTARRVRRLAGELGLERLFALGNMVRDPVEEDYLRAELPEGLPLLGVIPYDEAIRRAGQRGGGLPRDLPLHPQLEAAFAQLERLSAEVI